MDLTGDATVTTILGKYTMDRLLGKGAFAKVYHARSVETKASVAIKVIDKLTTSKTVAPLILREVSVMRRLMDHPNILHIHELLASKTKIYLVMELAQGGDLQALLTRRPGHRLPSSAALGIFYQLVSAIHFCHLHGVAHRDLKPENILLDDHNNVKLSDFGLSFIAGEGSVSSHDLLLQSSCGTPAFMAPEVMDRRRYDGAKADAWSCGIILYEMLVGALPFNSYDVLNVMYRKMVGRQFRVPSYLTPPVKTLICRLLDPNPNTRLSIDEIVSETWFKTSGFGSETVPLDELVTKSELERADNSSKPNAFDVIGLSYGLDLSGLFDDNVVRRKRIQFPVKEAVMTVAEKVVELGGKLGYEVKSSWKGGKVWLRRGRLLVMVDVLEVASELSMVEVVVEGCRCRPCDSGGGEFGVGEIRDGIEEVLHKYLS